MDCSFLLLNTKKQWQHSHIRYLNYFWIYPIWVHSHIKLSFFCLSALKSGKWQFVCSLDFRWTDPLSLLWMPDAQMVFMTLRIPLLCVFPACCASKVKRVFSHTHCHCLSSTRLRTAARHNTFYMTRIGWMCCLRQVFPIIFGWMCQVSLYCWHTQTLVHAHTQSGSSLCVSQQLPMLAELRWGWKTEAVWDEVCFSASKITV